MNLGKAAPREREHQATITSPIDASSISLDPDSSTRPR